MDDYQFPPRGDSEICVTPPPPSSASLVPANANMGRRRSHSFHNPSPKAEQAPLKAMLETYRVDLIKSAEFGQQLAAELADTKEALEAAQASLSEKESELGQVRGQLVMAKQRNRSLETMLSSVVSEFESLRSVRSMSFNGARGSFINSKPSGTHHHPGGQGLLGGRAASEIEEEEGTDLVTLQEEVSEFVKRMEEYDRMKAEYDDLVEEVEETRRSLETEKERANALQQEVELLEEADNQSRLLSQMELEESRNREKQVESRLQEEQASHQRTQERLTELHQRWEADCQRHLADRKASEEEKAGLKKDLEELEARIEARAREDDDRLQQLAAPAWREKLAALNEHLRCATDQLRAG